MNFTKAWELIQAKKSIRRASWNERDYIYYEAKDGTYRNRCNGRKFSFSTEEIEALDWVEYEEKEQTKIIKEWT